MKRVFYLCLLLVLFLVPGEVFALNEVNVYFFHSTDCNICKQEKVYLESLKKDRYPNMRIYEYEINNQENYKLMEEAKKLYGKTQSGVPFTVIGDNAYVGFNQGIKGTFQQNVYQLSTTKYENKLGQKLGITYRTDLDGEAKEYKENSSYTVEETTGKSHAATKEQKEKDSGTFQKYQSSIILVSVGLVLVILFLVLTIVEKRRDR